MFLLFWGGTGEEDENGTKMQITLWESHHNDPRFKEGVTLLVHDAEVKFPYNAKGKKQVNVWSSSMVLVADEDEAIWESAQTPTVRDAMGHEGMTTSPLYIDLCRWRRDYVVSINCLLYWREFVAVPYSACASLESPQRVEGPKSETTTHPKNHGPKSYLLCHAGRGSV